MALIAADPKHLWSFLPCYYVSEAKGNSFPHSTGSQEGSDLPKAVEGSGDGAARNLLPASHRLANLGKSKRREKLI